MKMKRIICILMVMMLVIPLGTAAVTAAAKDVTVTLDGELVDFPDTKPYIWKDRTLVPIRFVSEAMGADVSWDGDERKVTIVKGKDTIVTHIMSSKATLNGTVYTFDVSTMIKDDRTVVPLRFIAEMLNCKVDWDEDAFKVIITSPGAPEKFPEPKLTVHFPQNQYEGKLFWITVDNLRDYSDCSNYQFKIDFTSPAEFNSYDVDMGAILGWETHERNQWRSIKQADDAIFSVSSEYITTQSNAEKLNLYDGMPMEFTLTVKRLCSNEEKEYNFTETFLYPYPAD